MQNKFALNKIVRYLILGVVFAGLLFLSACAGRSPDEGERWRVPDGDLTRQQAFIGTAVAETNPDWHVPDGDPQQGIQAFQDYGCASCHTIPGVPGANALVGPPLTSWANRHYIAGRLANVPNNLIRWIRYPQRIEPGTAMPDMGVSEQDARNMAAYLYTLDQD